MNTLIFFYLVQTLRNWVIMASGLASTAFFVIIGLIAFLSAVGTRVNVKSFSPDDPIHFETFINNWFPVKVNLHDIKFLSVLSLLV